jgi:putative addiction module component (TIGR02574 family)
MIQAAEIEKMSLDERLQTMELLWASLARTPDAVPSPDWHGDVLAKRMAKIDRGEAEFLTIPELKERLRKPPR